MDIKKFIKENWGKLSIIDIMHSLSLNLYEILKIAFELKLYNKVTPDIGRRWTEDEEKFLKEHSIYLSVRQASNLLYRSHYATYQRVKLFKLDEMINKK